MIWRALTCFAVLSVLAACGDQSMTQQRRYETYGKADLFENGSEAQPLPDGVVAQGDLKRASDIAGPPPIDEQILARGQERYDIYCSPCHGLSGHADGMIVQRGFPAPPSFHSDRLRNASARHIFDVISNGYGVMYSYAARVPPRDRWAIVAYIRALQLSQHADVAVLPDARSKLP